MDPGTIEIDQASWADRTAEDLEGADGAAARAYREGSFFAKPPDGESNFELLERAAAWLHGPSLRHARLPEFHISTREISSSESFIRSEFNSRGGQGVFLVQKIDNQPGRPK